jgi:hypothetical protein
MNKRKKKKEMGISFPTTAKFMKSLPLCGCSGARMAGWELLLIATFNSSKAGVGGFAEI